MNVQLLIDAVVRQTTVLIAQLATSGGMRAPLAHVAGQVFVELAAELERQGLSRKVTADMFGISLRSYQRKVQRLRESRTEQGRSMWEAVLDYLGEGGVVTREKVLSRFHRDPEGVVASILHDLVDSGIVFASGTGTHVVYRVASQEELATLHRSEAAEGLPEFLWAHIYWHGPLTRAELVALLERLSGNEGQLDAALATLLESGRIDQEPRHARADAPRYRTARLVIAADAAHGFEASMYDHYQALVSTLCAKLDPETARSPNAAYIGGSTYSLDVGPDHPLRQEVLDTLVEFRKRTSDLRRRVNAHNESSSAAAPSERVVLYAGQTIFSDAEAREEEAP